LTCDLKVLIVARSGRQLAQAARAGGYEPIVVDLFGDLDTQASCVTNVVLTPGADLTFDSAALLNVLTRLRSTHGPMPLVWGSGWEFQPHLLAALAQSWRLRGCPIAALFAANDAVKIAHVCAANDILFPAPAFGSVSRSAQWLLKDRTSSGGTGVRRVGMRSLTGQREYLQREVAGVPLSAAFIARPGSVELLGVCEAFNLQPHPGLPYRFSAAVAAPERFAALAARLAAIAGTLSEAFDLRGLCGVDFIHDERGQLTLIEVNARPTATFDLLAEPGLVFRAHMDAATRAHTPLGAPGDARAMAVCYAERPIVVPKALNWPAWVADRPCPDTRVELGMPICSVSAAAATAAAARELIGKRFAQAMRLFDSQSALSQAGS